MDNLALQNHRERFLNLLRVVWIAMIVFLVPALANGAPVGPGIDTLARMVADSREEIHRTSATVGCPQGAANCKAALDSLFQKMATIASQLQTASNQVAQNFQRQQERLRSQQLTQQSAPSECLRTNEAGATHAALRQSVTDLPEEIVRVTAALQPQNLFAQVKQKGEEKARAIREGIAGQNAAMEAMNLNANGCQAGGDGLASLGSNSSEPSERGGRNGSRDSGGGGNSNLQMAALAMQGLGMLSGMMKNNNGSANSSGDQPSTTLEGFPTIENGNGLVPGDANGDGIPDYQQTPVQLGKAGNPNTVGFTTSSASTEAPQGTSDFQTNSVGVIPTSLIPPESENGLAGAFGNGTNGGAVLDSTTASVAGIAGGGIGGTSAEDAENAAGASQMPGDSADKAAEELSAGGKGLGGGGGGSMLGMSGNDGGGFGDFMNSLKAPFEKQEDANKGSADFGSGDKGALAKAGRDLASKNGSDLNLTKDSLFVRVTDRLSLACERAELVCKRTRRGQGEI